VATRWYRSPELVVTNRYSFPVDIWSVGCILGELIDGEPMFPGDDALDQLVKIYQLVGPLDRKLIKQMESMFGMNAHKLMGSKKNMTRQEICRKKLKQRYKKNISNDALDLLTRLLDNNPDTRPTAREALQHDWFADLLVKDSKLSSKLNVTSNKSTKVNVEKILGDLCMNSEIKSHNHVSKESEKKEKIFRFSDMQVKKKFKKNEKVIFQNQYKESKKTSEVLERSGLKGYYGMSRQNEINKENLEHKSRALINQKIRQKNFSVTKQQPKKIKQGLKMGFSMIPKLTDHSHRSRENQKKGVKSFINTAFGVEKRRMPGVSMGKSKPNKPFLKKKSKTTQLKSKVYQNTFSCLGYKINHKLGNLQKHLKQKRLHEGEKGRPKNDRKKRRIKERKGN
jgi:serine/threonine protein kinase